MNLLNVLLLMPQQGAGGAEGGGNSWMSFVFILLIIVVFYFFLIRPQSKQAKKDREFKESLQKGDRIITAGGIHGKIMEIDGQTVVIDVYSGKIESKQVLLKVEKSSIVRQAEQGK